MRCQSRFTKSRNPIIKLAAILTLLVIASLPHGLCAQEYSVEPTGKTLVIGKVSQSPKKHIQSLKLMADYLASHMHDLGYTKGKVLVSRNKEDLAEQLRLGKVDLVTETAFSAIYLQNKAGAEPILRKWKKGVAEYHSIIFVRKDSGINNLQDLKGKTIAFEDANSASAYYLPAAALIGAGLNLQQLSSPREKAGAEFLGYVFSKQEINTSIWVAKGRVDAGALSNLDWQKNDHMPESFRSDLKIIHTTSSIPRAIEVVRKTLPEEVKARIKTLMLNMDKDPDGYEPLRRYQKTRKFDPLSEETLKNLHKMDALLKIVDGATH